MILDIDDYRELDPAPINADPAEWSVIGVIAAILIAMIAGITEVDRQMDIVDASIERTIVVPHTAVPRPSSGTITCDCRVTP